GVRQHADQHMRLGPAAVVMPDRTQQQLTLEDTEGMLHRRQLDVSLPELFSRPAALITPQQVSTVGGQGRPELLPEPNVTHPRRLGLGHGDRHERPGFGKPALQPADTLEDLVAALEPTLLDPFLELRQRSDQAMPLTATNGPFLLTPWPASGQEIRDALRFEK